MPADEGGVPALNCSNCGAPIAPDAGFCRACGSIVRGKAATATVIPTAPAVGPIPPATGPEPLSPPLADAGYFAPPYDRSAWPVAAQQPSPPTLPGSYGHAVAPYWQPVPAPGSVVPPYGTVTPMVVSQYAVPAWDLDPRSPAATRLVSNVRARQHMLTLDLVAALAGVLLLVSVFIPWYTVSVSVDSFSVSVSTGLLGAHAGGWRWGILVAGTLIVVESLVAYVVFTLQDREWTAHRAAVLTLCTLSLALVVGAMVDSPFSNVAGLGFLNPGLGLGAYLGLAAGVIGVGAAVGRMFAGRPALTR